MYKDIRIVYDSAIEEQVVEIIKEQGICRYIKLPKIEGNWAKELRHLNCHIWPGTDSMIMLILETKEAREILDKFRTLKGTLEEITPLNIVVSPIEEII